MDGDFLLKHGTLSLYVPLIDLPASGQESAELDNIKSPLSPSSTLSSEFSLTDSKVEIAQAVSDKTSQKHRTAVFYDESLTYYIQLDIKTDKSDPQLSKATLEDFNLFLSFLKIVVDVRISGTVTITLPDTPSDRPGAPRSHPPRQVSQQQAFELFTKALDNSDLVFSGKLPQNIPKVFNEDSKTNGDTNDQETWTAIWEISTPITHPRVRLFKPKVVISATASHAGNVIQMNESVSSGGSGVPRLSHAVSMIQINTDNSTTSNTSTGSSKTVASSHTTSNSFSSDTQGAGSNVEVTVKFLDEFEPVEDTNLFGPLTNDQHLKPIRSRLAADRLISSSAVSGNNDKKIPGASASSPALPLDGGKHPAQEPIMHANSVPDIPHSTEDLNQKPGSHPSDPSVASSQPGSSSSTSSSAPSTSAGGAPISTISAIVNLPVFPAVNLRLRCTKATGMQDSIVAILEIDNSENALFNVLIKSAVLDFTAGSAVEFGSMTFPLWLSPGESSSIAYHLNHPDAGLPQTRVKPMTIVLNSIPVLGDISQEEIEEIREKVTLQKSERSENAIGSGTSSTENDGELSLIDYKTVGPGITTKWDTIVDFGVVAPPTPGSAAIATPVSIASASGGLKKLFKVSRSSSIGSLRSHQGSIVGTASSGGSSTRGATSQLTGLVLSFSAPSAVKVGEVFAWRVFAINKSFSNRHLTLYIQPKEKGDKLVSDQTSSIPVLEQTILQKMYEEHSLNGTGMGIVSLMNDVRIGPLGAQACYETEIKMLALAPGQFTLEGLTVVDLTTGDSYDCGRLLDVIVSN